MTDQFLVIRLLTTAQQDVARGDFKAALKLLDMVRPAIEEQAKAARLGLLESAADEAGVVDPKKLQA